MPPMLNLAVLERKEKENKYLTRMGSINNAVLGECLCGCLLEDDFTANWHTRTLQERKTLFNVDMF